MEIFIDTNVFVEFFQQSQGSLQELELLLEVIQKTKSNLWLPEQVKREFWKNRENKIKKLVSDFEKHSTMGDNPPLLIREDPRFEELCQAVERVDHLRRIIAHETKKGVDEHL